MVVGRVIASGLDALLLSHAEGHWSVFPNCWIVRKHSNYHHKTARQAVGISQNQLLCCTVMVERAVKPLRRHSRVETLL